MNNVNLFNELKIERDKKADKTALQSGDKDSSDSEDEKHEVKADDVTGIRGGPLMCDTQHENSKFKSSKRTRA